jgi:DNA repair protein RadC
MLQLIASKKVVKKSVKKKVVKKPVDKNQQVIDEALNILENRLRKPGRGFKSADDTKAYLMLKLAELEHEVFTILYLDTRHRLIEYVELFRGTVDSASVHPREVVKEALKRNAAAVIFAHNHPSGVPEPSEADKQLTNRLSDALRVLDIRVLDHIIVGGMETISFAERGLV